MISIKSEREINLMKQAGHINYLAHQYIEKFIVPGVTTLELDKKINEFVRRHGGICSCFGFEGFPRYTCISVNDEVVHGIPSKRKLKQGDIVKVDFTVRKDGYESDMTKTYFVGKVDDNIKKFVLDTEKSLYEGLKVIKEGAKIGDIGNAICTFAQKHGYGVVEELCGHGIGTNMHEDPEVPNYGEKGAGKTLKAGMTLAIEPMLTYGENGVYMKDNDWTIATDDRSYSAHFEHTVVVTKTGYELLTGE